MPKEEYKEQSLRKKKPYTRVTEKSQDRFKLFKSEDFTNRTETQRSSASYARILGVHSLNSLIINRAKVTGNKVKILDSGCGSVRCVDNLLSDKSLDDSLENISGISISYFSPVAGIMQKHGKRFTYYKGTVQDVLSKAPETANAFDFLFDVWGPYQYSEDKFGLIKQYHQALKAGGQALIYLKKNDLLIKNKYGNLVKFSTWAVEHFPETFSINKSKRGLVLTITKTTARLAFPEYKIESSKERVFSISSLSARRAILKVNSECIKKISVEDIKKSNGLGYVGVIVKPDESKGMVLRPM